MKQYPPEAVPIAKAKAGDSQAKFVSLRVKLLFAFSLVFSAVFAGTFYWFYTFTTDKIISRLRTDMQSTLVGAVAGVDVDELTELYAEAAPNAAGFSDDPRYQNQLEWFETVHSIEPRAWLYSFRVDTVENNRRVGPPAVAPGEKEIVYLVDLWANYDAAKAARFLEVDVPGPKVLRAMEEGVFVEAPEIYEDKWGQWMSAFAPLRDDSGRVVAVLGLDIEASYVAQVQQSIRDRILPSFILTYAALFILIYILSGILTHHLTELAHAAQQIGAGHYDRRLPFASRSYFPDEMDSLAQVFLSMIDSIRAREKLIRQSQQAEDEMRHALQEERELNELKSRFVSMVSHELRTPLTTIRTSIELLEQFGAMATPAQRNDYFQRVRSAVKNMTQLLEDVLTIGRTEAGKLEFQPVSLNLKDFCREIVEEMQQSVGTAYAIQFTSQGECPNAYLDKKLLRSILTNLLSNAIKYSPVGHPIEFDLRCAERTANFQIRDYGIGIPLEDQPRLFGLFHRASNVSTIRGTGLGLAIVKQCVVQHWGQVTFTSQEGQGTTFNVILPLDGKPLTPQAESPY